MFRQIVQRVSGLIRDLQQRLQSFQKSPPPVNGRKPTKRPKQKPQVRVVKKK